MQKKRLGIFPNLGKENVRIALPEFVQLCKDCLRRWRSSMA